MIYYLLFFTFLFFFWISFMIKDKDFFSPFSLFCLSYLFSSILLLLNFNVWGVVIDFNTYLLLTFGAIVFGIAYYFPFKFILKKRKQKNNIQARKVQIVCPTKKYFWIILLEFIILLLYTYFFVKAVGLTSLSNFSNIMHDYRLNTAYGDGIDSYIPSIVSQLRKFNWAAALVSVYIILNNMFVTKCEGKKYKIELKYIISILLYLPLTVLAGGRFDLIIFLLSTLIMAIVIFNSFRSKFSSSLKMIKKFLIALVIILAIFSTTRTLFGRNSNGDLFEHISKYFAGPIINLDYYLRGNCVDSYVHFGREIFKGIYDFMAKLGLLELEELSRSFVVINGLEFGNVYTAYKYMYSACGLTGVVVFQLILGRIFALMYDKIKKNKDFDINIFIIFYALSLSLLILHPFSELLFSTLISFNYFVLFLFIWLLKFFINKVRLN